MIPFGDLGRNYRAHQEAVDRSNASVLESGWFVLGKQVEAFEEQFAAYTGCAYAVGVGSGVDALHLALVACGVEPGDEVITVANTCVPTLSAVSLAGANPVLVDVDKVRGPRCEGIVRDLADAVGGEISKMKKKDSFFQLPGEPAKAKVRV